MARTTFVGFLVLALAACGGASTAQTQPSIATQSGRLEHESGVACHADTDCAICYRRQTCGEAIGASDPRGPAEECHVSPAAFCMPRRAHCDEGRCVAR